MVTKKLKWPANLTAAQRIAMAKAKMAKVFDNARHLLALHCSNEIVVFSNSLSSQIPRSYAAHAFRIFQDSMFRFEVIRLCALWDKPDASSENIRTVVALVDDPDVFTQLFDERRQFWRSKGIQDLSPPNDPEQLALHEIHMAKWSDENAIRLADKSIANLQQAIQTANSIAGSDILKRIMNSRNKHIAHSLEATHAEKAGPILPMKFADSKTLLDQTLPLIEKLFSSINYTPFSFDDSRKNDRECAAELWKQCVFTIESHE